MRPYNRYLVTLALLFTTTTVLFAVYGQQSLGLYFSVYLLEYLAATLVFAYLHPKARRLLNFTGYVLFGGFLSIVGLKVIELLVGIEIFSAGLTGTAVAQDLPRHKDPTGVEGQFDAASYLGSFGGIVSRLTEGNYDDVPVLVEQLRQANVPQDLRLTIDRSTELLAGLRNELDSTDTSLRKASVFLGLGEPAAAGRELAYADDSLVEARRMFEDLQVGVDTLANRLGVFGAGAGTPLRAAYDRLQPLLLRLNELSDQYADLYQQLEAGIDVPGYGDIPIYSTQLQFESPDTVYPGSSLRISGNVDTVDGPEPGTVSWQVLLDEDVIASLTTATTFEREIKVPENVLLGQHLLTVELPDQGLYEGTQVAAIIEVVQASPDLKVDFPRFMVLPTQVEVSGVVASPLGPASGASTVLQLGEAQTTVYTDERGRFAGTLPLSLSQLYLGPQSLLVSVEPREPWHGTVIQSSSLYIINIANLTIFSVGVLYVGFLLLLLWRRRRAPQSRAPGYEPTSFRPGIPGVPGRGVVRPRPAWAQVDPASARGRIVSAYHRAAGFLAATGQTVPRPDLTLRDFLRAIGPRPNAAFVDLTGAAERALYGAGAADEEAARQAERLERTVRGEGS